MINFDIDEIKRDLEGRSIEEKMDEIQGLINELDAALVDLLDLQEDVNEEYEEMMRAPILAAVASSAQKRGWGELVTVNDQWVIVTSKGLQIRLCAFWIERKWIIHITLATVIYHDTKRHKTYARLASELNLPYKTFDEKIEVSVDDDNLQDTLWSIITKLCEANDAATTAL